MITEDTRSAYEDKRERTLVFKKEGTLASVQFMDLK